MEKGRLLHVLTSEIVCGFRISLHQSFEARKGSRLRMRDIHGFLCPVVTAFADFEGLPTTNVSDGIRHTKTAIFAFLSAFNNYSIFDSWPSPLQQTSPTTG